MASPTVSVALGAWLAVTLSACSPGSPEPNRAMSLPPPLEPGWHSLLAGGTADQWRGFRSDRLPDGWRIVDGELTRVGRAGDIVTREQFGDFELALEWKVEAGGNSGIFYRVSEAPGVEQAWQSGPEYQILDDVGHADGARPETSAGACYGLYPAPRGAVRPAGEWNKARIVARGGRVEHWLNGHRVVAYELGSAEWAERVRGSKFADFPQYGLAPKGHIGLQDHGDWVAYRHVRIRIPEATP